MKTEFKSSFLRAIKKIRDEQIKSDIADVIENVEKATGIRNITNIKKLKGFKDCYRIRIANYRIGLKIVNNIVFFEMCTCTVFFKKLFFFCIQYTKNRHFVINYIVAFRYHELFFIIEYVEKHTNVYISVKTIKYFM